MVTIASPLSVVGRFYIYAIHGFVTEVMFTATWEFVVNVNWKLPGNTSVWSLPIYGLSALVIEQMYLQMKDTVPLPVRALIYTLWTYSWEFTTGYLLRQVNACPWDYSLFDGNFMGLVTLEYAPLWYLGNILVDVVVIRLTRQLHWSTDLPCKDAGSELGNGDVKEKRL